LLSAVIDDALSLDTRLVRTVRSLILRPGEVTRQHRAGRRVSYVPPLRAYLISAVIFFGLFTLFPNRGRVEVVMRGETPPAASPGSRMTFELPAHLPFIDSRYQEAAAAAKANPQAFARELGAHIPRTFFLLLPMFALLLELFYRKEGYYFEHLVFSLYYHAFVFLVFSALFLLARTDGWLPGFVRASLGTGLFGWLFAYLPIALRRVYGGSWLKTMATLAALGVLYFTLFLLVMVPLMIFVVLWTF
jgi:hypothetical protein